MSIFDKIVEHIEAKEHVTSDSPFVGTAVHYYVGNKNFAVLNENLGRIEIFHPKDGNKELREENRSITESTFMKKSKWNSIDLTQEISEELVFKLIDAAYCAVYGCLGEKEQEKILKKNPNSV